MSAAKCPLTGKVIHPTKEHAKAAIASLYRNGRGNPDYNAYRCGDHWHVGHSRYRFEARIRAALRPGRSPKTTFARNRRRST